MSEEEWIGPKVQEELARALREWARRGKDRPLARWIQRELDSTGAPVRLTIHDWQVCAEAVLAARQNGGLPASCVEPANRWIDSIMRFSRPDGSLATDFREGSCGAAALRARANRSSPAPGSGGDTSGEPTAWASPDRVLASLRDDGAASGDFLVVDQRDSSSTCQLEIFGAGRSWMGPAWKIAALPAPTSRTTIRPWISTATADLVEWSCRCGPVRLTRSILLLRGRRLALLAVMVETDRQPPRSFELRISLPAALTAVPVQNTRALLLRAMNERGSAQVLPIGLPCLAYLTERGAFGVEQNDFVLKGACTGRRTWLPVLISWEARRHRKRPQWRVLTVSERSRKVAAERAFAARVSWGKDEAYVIYRSLGPPGTRAFLGHQTRARFLVGRFTREGDVEPILKTD